MSTDPLIPSCSVSGGDAESGEVEQLASRLADLEDLAEQQRHTIAALIVAERRCRLLTDSVRGIVFYRGEESGEWVFDGCDAQAITGVVRADGSADRALWYRSIDPEDLPAYRALEQRRLQTGEGYAITFRYHHPLTGQQIWAQEHGYAATGEIGCRFLDGHVIDVTAARDQERQLREATETAVAANLAKTQFLASMSHELRTPLNAVIGFAEVIIDQSFGPLGSERYLEYCRDIHASATHLLRLVEDILDVSKIEAGRVELSETLFDVGRLINSTLRMVRDRAAEKGVMLTAAIDDKLPQICADERRIRQILLNLLSNAVKFTDTGGSVSVIAHERPDGGVDVVVCDTGIGIADADIPRAMQPFVQLHTGLNRQFEGSGIGLALSAKLAELHGGRLELASQLGSGTRVTLTLPPERSLRPPPRPAAAG